MNHPFLSILDQKLNREMPVRISRRNLVTSPGIDQGEHEGHLIARLRMWRVDLDLHRDCPFDHVRIMSPAPEVLASAADRTICGDRSVDLRHMATLADEASFLYEELAFVFSISTAASHIVELGRTGHDVVTAVANLRRAKIGIEFRRMGGRRILERPIDDTVPYMTGGTADGFLLIVRIVMGVRFLYRLLDAPAGNFLDKRWLLVFKRCMTV